jgi:hypothetical protein
MPYFIFNKNSYNSLYKIAENEEDLNLINGIQQDCYLKITSNQNDFDTVKLGQKSILPYNGSSVELSDSFYNFTRETLTDYLKYLKKNIKLFLEHNLQHSKFETWSNYLNYLNSINVDIVIPNKDGVLNTSLEEYIQSQGQTFYSIFQLP